MCRWFLIYCMSSFICDHTDAHTLQAYITISFTTSLLHPTQISFNGPNSSYDVIAFSLFHTSQSSIGTLKHQYIFLPHTPVPFSLHPNFFLSSVSNTRSYKFYHPEIVARSHTSPSQIQAHVPSSVPVSSLCSIQVQNTRFNSFLLIASQRNTFLFPFFDLKQRCVSFHLFYQKFGSFF